MVWWQTTLIIIGVIVFILFVIKVSTRKRADSANPIRKGLSFLESCCKRAVGLSSA